ncbi:MAG: hypothetical protein II627_02965, partial [Lachnospiraceae bacterium]|nr:hypothetical protein [Lachnospiraceae bacterium]
MTYIGKMFSNLKDIGHISLKELSAGICSRSYLSRVMRGKTEIKGIYIYYIMKRLFVSPDRFFILIDQKEYEYFLWLHNCQELVAKEQYEELAAVLKQNDPGKRFNEFGLLVQRDLAYFRYIVAREVKKDYPTALAEIKKNVDFMLAEDSMKPLNPGRYSTEELNRFMNYLDLMLEMGKVSLETAKITFDQIHQMASFSSRDPREEARLYPRIVCFTLKSIGEAFSPEIWDTMIREAIMYLRKTADCYDMSPLLALLCEAASYNEDPEEERYKNWYKAICIAFKEGEFPVGFNRYDAHDSHNQLYLIHEFLRRNRLMLKGLKGREFMQEGISDSIMDPSNYSRIERGDVRPRAANYKKLALKMGISSETYQGEITTSYLSDFQLLAEIRHAVNASDITALKEGLSVLNDHLDRGIVANAQLLDQFQVNLELMEGRINEEESIGRWIEILNYTVPYEPDEKRIYTDLEINIIYKIVRSKRRLRIMTDQDVHILEAVLNSEKASQITSWERI